MNQPTITIRSLQKIRVEISALLPIGHSFIPFDILLATYCGDENGNELTVKALFASLPYSDMGIRYHFKKLLDQGWLELQVGEIDTRIKRVKPSMKLIEKLIELDDQLLVVFKYIQSS